VENQLFHYSKAVFNELNGKFPGHWMETKLRWIQMPSWDHEISCPEVLPCEVMSKMSCEAYSQLRWTHNRGSLWLSRHICAEISYHLRHLLHYKRNTGRILTDTDLIFNNNLFYYINTLV
jgi:hypothetical protein